MLANNLIIRHVVFWRVPQRILFNLNISMENATQGATTWFPIKSFTCHGLCESRIVAQNHFVFFRGSEMSERVPESVNAVEFSTHWTFMTGIFGETIRIYKE